MQSRRHFLLGALAASTLTLASSLWVKKSLAAQATSARSAYKENGMLMLPAPDKRAGMSLMQALERRRSVRGVTDQDLTDAQLSDLLWATWGVNRDDGRRTAPTARNTQEVAVFAAMRSGVWLYDGDRHALVQKLSEDTRREFGGAPLTLVYAAEDGLFGAMHLGSLYQNAGLYCASAGLANVVKATGVDVLQKKGRHAALGLPAGYRIMIVQSIGLPV